MREYLVYMLVCKKMSFQKLKLWFIRRRSDVVENSTATATEKSKIKRTGTKRKKPGIKLTVLSVSNVEGQTVSVECQLDTSKQKTVTFKFDRDDMVPADIANNLVS